MTPHDAAVRGQRSTVVPRTAGPIVTETTQVAPVLRPESVDLAVPVGTATTPTDHKVGFSG